MVHEFLFVLAVPDIPASFDVLAIDRSGKQYPTASVSYRVARDRRKEWRGGWKCLLSQVEMGNEGRSGWPDVTRLRRRGECGIALWRTWQIDCGI